jgi:hypothetical protein
MSISTPDATRLRQTISGSQTRADERYRIRRLEKLRSANFAVVGLASWNDWISDRARVGETPGSPA